MKGDGAKYRGEATLAEIKAGIIADLKAAVAEGKLPKGVYRVSARKPGGSPLNRPEVKVVVTGLPFPIHRRNQVPPESWMTDPALDCHRRVEAIVDAYGYDRSEPETDYYCYAFGSSVTLEAALGVEDLPDDRLLQPGEGICEPEPDLAPELVPHPYRAYVESLPCALPDRAICNGKLTASVCGGSIVAVQVNSRGEWEPAAHLMIAPLCRNHAWLRDQDGLTLAEQHKLATAGHGLLAVWVVKKESAHVR